MNMNKTLNSDFTAETLLLNKTDVRDGILAMLMAYVGKDVTNQIVEKFVTTCECPMDGFSVMDTLVRSTTLIDASLSEHDYPQPPNQRMDAVHLSIRELGIKRLISNEVGDDVENLLKYTCEEAVSYAAVAVLGREVSVALAEALERSTSTEVAARMRETIEDVDKSMQRLMRAQGSASVPTELLLTDLRNNLHPDWQDKVVRASAEEVEARYPAETKMEVPESVREIARNLGIPDENIIMINALANSDEDNNQEDDHDEEPSAPPARKSTPSMAAALSMLAGLGMGSPKMPEPVMRAPQRDITVKKMMDERWGKKHSERVLRQAERTNTMYVLDYKISELKSRLDSDHGLDEHNILKLVYGTIIDLFDDYDLAVYSLNSPYKEATPGCACRRCRIINTVRSLDIYLDAETGEPLIVKSN